MRRTKMTTFILVLMLISGAAFGGSGFAATANLDNNWASESILSLEEQGIFDQLWADGFSTYSTISHEDTLQLLAEAFQLSELEKEDLTSWLNELLVADPEGITRGEFAAALGNLLGLGEHSEVPKGFYPSFADLNMDYPGFMGIELLQRLTLFPTHFVGRFEPYRLITHGEVAFIVDQALQLDRLEGSVEDVQDEDKRIVLKLSASEDEQVLDLRAETLYVSPSSLTRDTINRDETLQTGQHIEVLVRDNQALLVNLDETTTAQALMDGVNRATQVLTEILTQEQLNALLAGDWDTLGEEVRYEIYEELVDRGIAPWEADALIKQDWSNLQLMVEERLTQEAANYLDVTPELVQAALNQNWTQLLEYAQVELAQRLLTSDWLSNTLSE